MVSGDSSQKTNFILQEESLNLCVQSGPQSGFAALGINFQVFLGKSLCLKNVEHALCEYDKYYRSALSIQIKEKSTRR